MGRPARFLSLGVALVDWMETFLVHGPGDVEGQGLSLDDEFASFVVRAYQVTPAGRRVKRRAVISRPKGRAKSELMAAIAVAEGLAPVRFDHFAEAGEVSYWGYEYAEGEPVGRPVTRPIIRCFATEEGQAGNTYDAIVYMLDPSTCSPALLQRFGKVDVGLTRTNLPGRGEITPESAADSSKDGGKETFCVYDETHLWILPRLHRLHRTVNRNLLKRKAAEGWSAESTTMFAPGEGSVAEGTFNYAKSVTEGRVADDQLLFDHREAAPKWDARKRADRVGGLREVYGPASEWMDLPIIAASFDDPQVTPQEWERYWFNRGVSIQGRWLDQRGWDRQAKPGPIPDGADVVLSLDGSYNGDSTALVAVSIADPLHVTVAGVWERPQTGQWTVPILDVEQRIRDSCSRWRVAEVCADPYRWARTLEVLAADGVPVETFTQSAQRMTPATSRIAALLADGSLTHDGSAELTRHVSNAVLKVDSRGQRIAKETTKSERRIDLAVAMVMGVDRASWWRDHLVPADYNPNAWNEPTESRESADGYYLP